MGAPSSRHKFVGYQLDTSLLVMSGTLRAPEAMKFTGVYSKGSTHYIQVNFMKGGATETVRASAWHSREEAAIARDIALLWNALQLGRDLSQLNLNLPLRLYQAAGPAAGGLEALRGASFEELQQAVQLLPKALAPDAMQAGGKCRAGAAAAGDEGDLTDSGGEEEEQEEELRPTKRQRHNGGGFVAPVQLSSEMAAFLGVQACPRPQVCKLLWEYIKANKLQDPRDGRIVRLDAKLSTLFQGPTMMMFEMNKQLSKHCHYGKKVGKLVEQEVDEGTSDDEIEIPEHSREQDHSHARTGAASGPLLVGVRQASGGLYEALIYHSSRKRPDVVGHYTSSIQAGVARDIAALWARQQKRKELTVSRFCNFPQLQLHTSPALLAQLAQQDSVQQLRAYLDSWMAEEWAQAARKPGAAAEGEQCEGIGMAAGGAAGEVAGEGMILPAEHTEQAFGPASEQQQQQRQPGGGSAAPNAPPPMAGHSGLASGPPLGFSPEVSTRGIVLRDMLLHGAQLELPLVLRFVGAWAQLQPQVRGALDWALTKASMLGDVARVRWLARAARAALAASDQSGAQLLELRDCLLASGLGERSVLDFMAAWWGGAGGSSGGGSGGNSSGSGSGSSCGSGMKPELQELLHDSIREAARQGNGARVRELAGSALAQGRV